MRNVQLARLCAVLIATAGVAAPVHADFEGPSPAPSGTLSPFNPKIWELSVRTFLGFDDNVQLVSDGDPFFDGDTDSAVGGISIKGVVSVPFCSAFNAGAALQVDRTRHFDDVDATPGINDPHNDYDLTVVSPTVFAEHRFIAAGKPAKIGLSYSFRNEEGDVTALGLEAHSVSLDARLSVNPTLQLGVNYTGAWSNFDVSFPDSSLNSRDAESHAITLDGRWWFDGRRRSIGLSYTYADNNAEGRNFDYDGHTFGAHLRSHLYGPLYGNVSTSYAYYDYRGFESAFVTPPGRENQEIYTIGANVLWAISRNWTADAYVNYADYESNQRDFEGDRTQYGVGLTFRF